MTPWATATALRTDVGRRLIHDRTVTLRLVRIACAGRGGRELTYAVADREASLRLA